MPTKPVEITLPKMSTTEQQKYSHKDFYHQDENEEKPEQNASLIQKKLALLKDDN